tara:strand:+ start:547 stop:2382 length:1836 start_codon:yes stop_codon:yes gene_type:complete
MEDDDDNKCKCRLWDKGSDNKRCNKKRLSGDDKYCEYHKNYVEKWGDWWLGFIDEDRPEEPHGPPSVKKPSRHYWHDQQQVKTPKKKTDKKPKKEPKKEEIVLQITDIPDIPENNQQINDIISDEPVSNEISLPISESPVEAPYSPFTKRFTDKYNLNYDEYKTINDKIFNIFSKENYYEILEEELITTDEEQDINDEVSTPYILIKKILSYIDDEYFLKSPRILDYCSGKGSIIYNTFIHYYNVLHNLIPNEFIRCKYIIECCLFIGDLNHKNVFISCSIIKYQADKFSNSNYDYKFNYYIGDAMKLNLLDEFGINNMDGIFVNPPFHDEKIAGSTQHKLWIPFTIKSFDSWLNPGGLLLQISPESFGSPSNKILDLMKDKNTKHIHFNQRDYFPTVGTTIAFYLIENKESEHKCIINGDYELDLSKVEYIPQDPCSESVGIHNKVMFIDNKKIDMRYDYCTAHNNILLKSIRAKTHSTLSKTKTETHIYPVFHTNKQVWYSELKQEIFDKKKVMFTRSGYTKIFYDKGTMGITDMGYYILVESDEEGETLTHNLNLKVFTYILKSARWCGFGNEKVFSLLPDLREKKYTDDEINKYFKLTDEEIAYINS